MNTPIAHQKETITYEDFSKLDLRVGTIVAAEKMPKANKLLVLKVDTGLDVRTIVSGIAESFSRRISLVKSNGIDQLSAKSPARCGK